LLKSSKRYPDVEDGMYRARFSKPLKPDVAKFVSSVEEDARIFEADVLGSIAHVKMLGERGYIPEREARSIIVALADILRDFKRGKVRLSPEHEDVHELVEALLVKRVGLKVGGKMHMGRSRNDQVALDLRIFARREIVEVCRLINKLQRTLLELAGRHVDTIIPLYTHTQQAQVGSLGHYLLYCRDMLRRDLDRLLDCYRRVNESPLGACAVGGTSFKLDRVRTAKLLGFDGLVENSIDAVSSRDFAVECIANLAILMANLSRMAEDLILWSSQEFGYIEIADEYASPSSVMPQKKNPCSLELIRARSGKVYGSLLRLLTLLKGIPMGYNRDLQESKPPLWESFDVAKSSLAVMDGVYATLRVNADSFAKGCEKGFLTALDLAEVIVREAGISFREAHAIVGKLVKSKSESGKTFRDVTAEELTKMVEEVSGKVVDGFCLKAALDPYKALRSRVSRGSPSPAETMRMVRQRKRELRKYSRRIEALERREREVEEKLTQGCF
jgi:argininosuccinate lyase